MKKAKLQSISVKCTQLGSEQNMKKLVPQNFSYLSPVSLTLLINSHSRLSHRKFWKKFKTILVEYSGALGPDTEKSLKSKISCQTPLNTVRPTTAQQEPVDQRKEDAKDRIVTQNSLILTAIFIVYLKRQYGSILILNTTTQQFPTP
jgi:hypothetical protein